MVNWTSLFKRVNAGQSWGHSRTADGLQVSPKWLWRNIREDFFETYHFIIPQVTACRLMFVYCPPRLSKMREATESGFSGENHVSHRKHINSGRFHPHGGRVCGCNYLCRLPSFTWNTNLVFLLLLFLVISSWIDLNSYAAHLDSILEHGILFVCRSLYDRNE